MQSKHQSFPIPYSIPNARVTVEAATHRCCDRKLVTKRSNSIVLSMVFLTVTYRSPFDSTLIKKSTDRIRHQVIQTLQSNNDALD